MKAKVAATGIMLVALILFACPALAQPVADYGDAPDPNFPSLFLSNGPYHTTLTDCYVGWMSNAEPDALVPDMDMDDGAPLIFAFLNAAGVWTGWVYVPITIDAAAPGPGSQNRYLNCLIDCNSSGQWCDISGEWIVRNYMLPSYGGIVHYPGQTVWYCIGGFTWVTDYSGLHYLRVTLSDTPVAANVPLGWDGSWGGFNIGETEDWALGWFYHPPPPPNPPDPPPHDPGNPPPPAPVPDCNKTTTVEQVPPPTHRGHSGNFAIRVTNTSPNHPIHIVAGPFETDVHGDPINIDVYEQYSTILDPGESVDSPSSWDFVNPGPNQAWCNWDVVVDPQGQYVVAVNVGNYDSPTGTQPTGGSFLEAPGAPSTTSVGLGVLLVALCLIPVYFIVRRFRFAAKS